MMIYYPVSFGYFFIAFSCYAAIAGGFKAIGVFWRNIIPVALTSLATGSSIATIPSNLEASKKTGINQEVADVVIPIGATIHMEGSALAAILKIALLFGLYQMPFEGFSTIAVAVGIALLSATVMSGISGGGFLGEMLIISMYGFPLEALPLISLIGTLVDPPATMVNAVGDHSAGMMITRFIQRKKIL
jgi:Na+/H+-dicarboxylate symporter